MSLHPVEIGIDRPMVIDVARRAQGAPPVPARARAATGAAAAGGAGGPTLAAPDVRGTRDGASRTSKSTNWSSLSPNGARSAPVAKRLLAPSINAWSHRRSRERAIWLSCLSLQSMAFLLATADKLTIQANEPTAGMGKKILCPPFVRAGRARPAHRSFHQ